MKLSIMKKFPVWVYEEIDPEYSSIPGFRELVKEQGSFNKARANHVLCYHLIESSAEQLLGCTDGHKVNHFVCLLISF
jgi:hypothetical protein